jgi:hypothetical protein
VVRAVAAVRSEWTPGPGNNSSSGWTSASSCQSVRCSAS